MDDPFYLTDIAISELVAVRKVLKKNTAKLVRSLQELLMMKATSLAWFRNHRPDLTRFIQEAELSEIDRRYADLLSASDKTPTRTECLRNLRDLRQLLIDLRYRSATTSSSDNTSLGDSDRVPDFSSLVTDPKMQVILRRRWQECITCISTDAPLAATIMMGGLLEGLLLARINHEANKAPIFRANSAPKDKTGQTLPLKDWTLHNYVDVAHELGWISQSAKDVGQVLRDYRNFVHPYKEFSQGIELSPKDISILWEVSKSLSRQILASL